MTTRTNIGNKLGWFIRKAYHDWPWTFWTVVVIVAATWIPAFIWPEVFVVMVWVWGLVLAAAFIVTVIVKIAIEIGENTL